jgi:hypothetical protein
MKRQFRWVLIAWAVVALAAHARPARAQLDDFRASVEREIDLTDRRIELAQGLLTGCPGPEAGQALDLGIQIQADAKTTLAGAANRMGMEQALRRTREARGVVDRAIALARCCVEGPRIEVQLERTRDLLERARDRVESCRQDRARALMRAAVDQQALAQGAFGAGRCLIALQLTLRAREKAFDAMRLCGFEDRMEDRVQRFLAQTDLHIDRVRERVAERGGDQARSALALAMDLQSRAQAQFGEQHFEASLRLSRAARAAADRALRLADAGR